MQHWSPDTYDKDATQLHREMDAWNMDTYATPAVLLAVHPEAPIETDPPALDADDVFSNACGAFQDSSFGDFKAALEGKKAHLQNKAMACLMSIMGENHDSMMDKANAFLNKKQAAADQKHSEAFEDKMAKYLAEVKAHEDESLVTTFDSTVETSDRAEELKGLSADIKKEIMAAFSMPNSEEMPDFDFDSRNMAAMMDQYS